MMKKFGNIAVITACMFTAWQPAVATAQSGGQAPGTTATPTTPAPPASGATPARLQTAQPPMSAATFVERARAGNAFEIESSRLALEKATQPALKNFARTMIDDHTRADQKLVSVARSQGQAPAETVEMEPRQRRQIEALTGASGAEFDKLYASAQREAHHMAVQLYQTYAETGTDKRLREFARETLPILQGHMQQIENMTQ